MAPEKIVEMEAYSAPLGVPSRPLHGLLTWSKQRTSTRPIGGSNSIIISSEALKNGTTAAHEDGHGFGIFYHTFENLFWTGIPNIMTTKKTLVESQYTVNPSLGDSQRASDGSVINPLDRSKRKVTQDDINCLNIDLVNMKVGNTDNKIWDKSGTHSQ